MIASYSKNNEPFYYLFITYLMAQPINVVALIKIKPENIKDAEPLVKQLAEKSREEPGNVKYEIYRVKEREGVYIFL